MMNLEKLHYNQFSKEFLDQISKGAFLSVRLNDELNTMTIGWANIGFIWGRPIITVMVRYSRHTYNMLDKSNEFCISIPLNKQLKKELGVCGKESGRDINKFETLNITPVDAQYVKAPIVGECDLHYECKVIYKQAMEPVGIDKKIDEQFYNDHDFHVMFYGEILDCYLTKQQN